MSRICGEPRGGRGKTTLQQLGSQRDEAPGGNGRGAWLRKDKGKGGRREAWGRGTQAGPGNAGGKEKKPAEPTTQTDSTLRETERADAECPNPTVTQGKLKSWKDGVWPSGLNLTPNRKGERSRSERSKELSMTERHPCRGLYSAAEPRRLRRAAMMKAKCS